MNEEEIISSVWPSAGAFATNAAPIEPVAPARFSTTTGLPKASDSRLAMARAKMSFEPPGGEVTMNWTGLAGRRSVPCASAGPQASARTSSQLPCRLLLLDTGVGRDFLPDADLLLDLRGELLRRAAGRRDAVVLQLLGGLLQLERLGRRRR